MPGLLVCAWVLGAKMPLSKQPGSVAAAQRRVKYQPQLTWYQLLSLILSVADALAALFTKGAHLATHTTRQ